MWNLRDMELDTEIERVSKSAFDRGYEAGKLARATDEWQLERDRRLARDILAGFGPESFGGAGFRASLLDALRPRFGTTPEKTGIMGDARLDELLTKRLIYLLGGGGGTGLHDARAGGGDSDGGGDNEHQVVSEDETASLMRDVLESERREAVRELREIGISSGGFVKALAGAIGVEWRAPRVAQTIATIRDRLIHLLGGDECNFSGAESYMNAMGEKSNPAETSDESTDHVTLATPSSEDGTCPNPVQGASIIDKLGNERHKAVCELRKLCERNVHIWKAQINMALGLGLDASNEDFCDRLIHLLGGDQPTLSDLYGILQDGAESENKGGESAHKMTKSAEIGKLDVNGTSPNDDGTCPNDDPTSSITDELREFATDPLLGYASQELHVERITAIADRIDEQFDRICEQQEAALQSTIDSMCKEQDRLQERLRAAELGCDANHRLAEANAKWADDLLNLLRDAAREYEDKHHWAQAWHDRAEDMRMECDNLQQTIDETAAELDSTRAKNRRLTRHVIQMQGGSKKLREECKALKAERDELQAKLDDYDRTHVELPKDENDEQVSIGDMVHDGEEGYDFRVDGFKLWGNTTEWWAFQDKAVQQKLERCSIVKPPTVEQVIRDLTLGKITESQAVERIEGMHGKG